jgi:galactose mutarotase-like enzyme
MYSISLEENQYKTYILTDDSSNSQLEVVPERGGIITKWRVNGEEIFYLDEERFTNPELSVRGGNPILFPICGNLPENTYTVASKQYNLKQHGFARDLPWIAQGNVQEEGVSLQVTLNSTEITKAVYPFDFQATFTYHLKGDSLTVSQHYLNKSAKPMPFSFGFHPYFNVKDKTKLKFEIPAQEYFDHKTQQINPFSGNFDYNQDEIDVAFKKIHGKSATVTDSQRQLKLTLDYDDVFSTLVFWTVKGKDFYCLEPWSAPRNSINTGEKLTTLEPGASYATSIKLTAKFI